VSAAQELAITIESHERWSWARNPQNIGKLQGMLASLRGSMTGFHNAFLAEEPGAIRRRHDKEYILTECASLGSMDLQVADLLAFIKVLQKRNA